MIIIKKINSNVVLSEENGREVILTGKGIGFHDNPGELVRSERIEKKYYPETDLTLEQMLVLIAKATDKELEVIYEIIHIGSYTRNTDKLFAIIY